MMNSQSALKQEKPVEVLDAQNEKLEVIIKGINKRIMLKWIWSFIGFVLSILFAQFVVILVINSLLAQNSGDLKAKIEEMVGSQTNIGYNTLAINDVLFPAWNQDDRYPLFFSVAHQNSTLTERPEYKMKLSEMITASASNSVYFNPYKFQVNNTYSESIIGGGSIAESPAMYSFFSAEQFIKVQPEKISMTVVGALHKDTAKISGNVNPI